MRFSRSLLVALPVLSSALVLSSLPRHSLALDAKIETEAKALQKKAIEEDNLYAKYADAVAKLRAAITMCAGDKCSSKLRSTLYRDMGAMQHLAGSKDTGNASFREALKIDRTLELAVEYKSRALEEAWDAVKQSLAGPVGEQPKGDFEHTPFAEQLVRTPLAIYAEYGAGEKVTIVKLGYRGAGMSEFKSVELTKQGKGWLTILPCTIVTEGVFKYYLEGFDDEGNRVAGSGTRSRPYQIPIRSKIAGDIPRSLGFRRRSSAPTSATAPPA
jgi:tetratricopeptide (TPR) repeat protein